MAVVADQHRSATSSRAATTDQDPESDQDPGQDPAGATEPVGPQDPIDEPRDQTVDRRHASALAITSVVLGALGTAMALGVVWFFMALPFGIAAATCAIVDRVRTRQRTGTAAGGVTTVGLVLGLACIPLSIGAMLIIPRVESLARDSAAEVQGDVRTDLHSVERSTNGDIKQVDSTLRELVASSDKSTRDDLDRLEKQLRELVRAGDESNQQLIVTYDRSTRNDLARLDAAQSDDVARMDARIASLEALLRSEIDRLEREIERLRTQGTGPTG